MKPTAQPDYENQNNHMDQKLTTTAVAEQAQLPQLRTDQTDKQLRLTIKNCAGHIKQLKTTNIQNQL